MIEKNKKGFAQKGFTVIELLVSIAIMSIIMSVALYKQIDFNRAVAFSNAVVEITNDIRETRFKALGVTYSEDINPVAYGIRFYEGLSEYRLTAYTKSGDSFDLINDPSYFINKNFSFSDLRLGDIKVSSLGNLEDCQFFDSEVEIVFERPNAQALFFTNVEFDTRLPCDSVSIVFNVNNNDDITKTITIGRTGQVSIE